MPGGRPGPFPYDKLNQNYITQTLKWGNERHITEFSADLQPKAHFDNQIIMQI